MQKIDSYALFSALGIGIVFVTTHFTLLRERVPRAQIYIFTLGSLALVYLAAKMIGTLGFWLSRGLWIWGPASVMGFLFVEVIFWRRWARSQAKVGPEILRKWAITGPLAQAIGRGACFFEGC